VPVIRSDVTQAIARIAEHRKQIVQHHLSNLCVVDLGRVKGKCHPTRLLSDQPLLVDRERSGVSFLLLFIVLLRFSTNRDIITYGREKLETFTRTTSRHPGVLFFLHRSSHRTMYAPPCNFIIIDAALLLHFALRFCVHRVGMHVMHQQMGLLASHSSSNNFVFFCSQVPWQLYY
jgi:hypothetical protein